MAAAPAFLLILGSILLAVWRGMGRRAGQAAEVALAGLALLGGLLLGRSIPVRSSFLLWPPDLSPSGSFELAVTPWTWALLVCVLAFGFAHVLTVAPGGTSLRPTSLSSTLVFIAAISLATLAANALTLLLTWTFAIGAQAWLVRTRSPVEKSAPLWREVKGRDLATLLLVIAAFGVAGPATSWVASTLLAVAAVARVWSAVSATTPGDGWTALLGWPTMASVLGALAWGWSAERTVAMTSGLAVAGSVLVFAGWVSSWLAETTDHRARGWMAGIGGLALLGMAASPGESEAALAGAGSLLILAGAVGTGFLLGKTGSRIGASIAAMMTIGTPGLVGAILLGVALPAARISALGWVIAAGAGLLASIFLTDVRRPRTTPESSARSPSVLVAASVMTMLSVTLYFRLRGLVPPPAWAAVPAALLVAIVGFLLWEWVGGDRRMRMARILRWPAGARSPRGALAPAGPAQALVRGVRDVLEGDAALLWALVVVVVGLLLLQGAT